MLIRLLMPFALLLTPAGGALAQDSAKPDAAKQSVTQTVAQGMQPLVGQTFDGGIKIHAVSAEGDVLVVTVDAVDGWKELPRADAGKAFVTGFCGDGDTKAFFEHSALRVDTLEKGASLVKGEAVRTCPAPAAQ